MGDGYGVQFYKGSPNKERLADVWFQGEGTVARVSRDEYQVFVVCCGDMSFIFSDESEGFLYRQSRSLDAHGIDTDNKLREAIESGRVEFDMNPWFNLDLDSGFF